MNSNTASGLLLNAFEQARQNADGSLDIICSAPSRRKPIVLSNRANTVPHGWSGRAWLIETSPSAGAGLCPGCFGLALLCDVYDIEATK